MNQFETIKKADSIQNATNCFFGASKNTTSFIQPKLTINQPNDVYEQEADAMADKVMRMEQPDVQLKPLPIAAVQRKCEHCKEEEKKMQRKEMNEKETTANSSLENYVSSLSGGQSLPDEARNFYEPRFGHDFSNVKIHTDTVAAKSAQSINALAYTSGNNIVFNNGQYSPDSNSGKRLLGHELTHVVQQGGGIGKKVQRYGHEDCDETLDLRPHIWPADPMAKAMVDSAILALSATPVSAATNSLLDKHFNDHSASTVSSVLEVFTAIKAAFTANDYTYECENDCDTSTAAYVYGIWSDIHMCMNELRGKSNRDVAGIIVHEFSHYYGGTDDEQYYFFYGHGGAPSSLSTSDAIDNADSYGGFAYDI